MREKMIMFAMGAIVALGSFFVFDKLVDMRGDARAQRAYQVEVVYDVAGGSYFKSEIEKKLGEGYRVVGFSSYFIPSDEPGIVALMVK